MADFRALCAELVDIATAHCDPDDYAVGHCAAVLTRARAALAQPEADGVTDPVSGLVSQCRPLDPEMAECLTPSARWRLYGDEAQPEAEGLPPRVGHILRLADIIREVDGSHSLGAAALAEAILGHPGCRWQPCEAQPEAEVPTDSELNEICWSAEGAPFYGRLRTIYNLGREHGSLAAAQPAPPTDEELLAAQDQAVASFPPIHPDAQELSAVEYARELEIRKARAVLARWGRPAPQPIPVSERLPIPEECDAQGRCWIFDQGDAVTDPAWNLEHVARLQELRDIEGEGALRGLCYRWRLMWLPFSALPFP